MTDAAEQPRPAPSRGERWLVLAAVSLAMFGNYYVFDALDPVAPLLVAAPGLGFTNERIGLLDFSYNLAALLVLVAGGVIIDRVGTKRAMVAFGVVTAAGGALIAAAPGFRVMAAGRFLLGVGAEPLIVAGTTILGRWFKGKELSLAMALNLTAARLGSVAADNARTWAAPLFGAWRPPLVLAAAMGATAMLGGIASAALERRAEQRGALGRASATDRLVLGDVVRFDAAYWYVVGLCVAFYGAVFPFRRFANLFFVDARGISQEAAGFMNGLLPLSAMFATPLFGLLADRIGKRAFLMAAGTILFAPVFLLMTFAPLPLGVPVAMMGIAFSLVPAVMWPAVTYLVDEKRLGTAYGLMTFCQQVVWGATSWLIGRSNDAAGASAANPAGYGPMMWILSALFVLAVALSLALWRAETGPRAHGLESISGAKPVA